MSLESVSLENPLPLPYIGNFCSVKTKEKTFLSLLHNFSPIFLLFLRELQAAEQQLQLPPPPRPPLETKAKSKPEVPSPKPESQPEPKQERPSPLPSSVPQEEQRQSTVQLLVGMEKKACVVVCFIEVYRNADTTERIVMHIILLDRIIVLLSLQYRAVTDSDISRTRRVRIWWSRRSRRRT